MEPARMDARRRPGRLRLMVGLLVAMSAALMIMAPSAMAIGQMLIYTGNGAINEGYSQFAAAAGRTQVTSSSLPATDAQWDSYGCVVLPVPTVGFSNSERNAILNYAGRGGTVVALAEHLNAD